MFFEDFQNLRKVNDGELIESKRKVFEKIILMFGINITCVFCTRGAV